MAIYKEDKILDEIIPELAKKIIVAARTAPKTRGMNNLITAVLTSTDISLLANKMKEIGEAHDNHIFLRDSHNVRDGAKAVVLLGCKINTAGLQLCGLCGFENCDEKNKYPDTPCSFNTTDLGIAVGSAVATAADLRIDNRVMYTIGMAAKELNQLGDDCKIIYGIPLSASSKNPFFDRK